MPVVCDVCEFVSKTPADNRCHKNFSHRKKKVIFRCKHCKKTYLKFKSYQEHLKTKHKIQLCGRLKSRIKEEVQVTKKVWKAAVLTMIEKRGRDRLGWMQYNIQEVHHTEKHFFNKYCTNKFILKTPPVRRLIELCYFNDVYSIRVNWQDFPESYHDSYEPFEKLLTDVPEMVEEFMAARTALKTEAAPVLSYKGESQGHSGPSRRQKKEKKAKKEKIEKPEKKEEKRADNKGGNIEKVEKMKKIEKAKNGEKIEKEQKVETVKKVKKVQKVQKSTEITEIIDLLNESVISTK